MSFVSGFAYCFVLGGIIGLILISWAFGYIGFFLLAMCCGGQAPVYGFKSSICVIVYLIFCVILSLPFEIIYLLTVAVVAVPIIAVVVGIIGGFHYKEKDVNVSYELDSLMQYAYLKKWWNEVTMPSQKDEYGNTYP